MSVYVPIGFAAMGQVPNRIDTARRQGRSRTRHRMNVWLTQRNVCTLARAPKIAWALLWRRNAPSNARQHSHARAHRHALASSIERVLTQRNVHTLGSPPEIAWALRWRRVVAPHAHSRTRGEASVTARSRAGGWGSEPSLIATAGLVLAPLVSEASDTESCTCDAMH